MIKVFRHREVMPIKRLLKKEEIKRALPCASQRPKVPAHGFFFTEMPMSASKKAGNKLGNWFLYILKCSDTTLYTGITNDLQRRLERHNAGSASRYTRSRRPVKLIYYERCRNKSSALKKECSVKSLSREEKENYIRRKRETPGSL
jgi:putative endonuclease